MLLFQCRGIDASIFQLPSKIHLTIGMLTLLSEKDVVRKGMICSCMGSDDTSNNINDNPGHLVTGFLFNKLIIHSSHSVTPSCKQLHPLSIEMEF